MLLLVDSNVSDSFYESGLCPGVTDSPTWHPPTFKLGNGHKELLSDCKVTVLHKYFPSPPKTCWLREYQTEGENTDVFVMYMMWLGVFWLFLNNGGFFSRELEVLKLHWNLNLTHPIWTVQTHSLLAQLGQLR